jgi:hypothetical protein
MIGRTRSDRREHDDIMDEIRMMERLKVRISHSSILGINPTLGLVKRAPGELIISTIYILCVADLRQQTETRVPRLQ